MSGHTPGPWTVDPDDTEEFGLYRVREIDPERYTQGQDVANARLIAAAPQLLDACRMVLDHLAYLRHGESNVADDLRAAIAAATGETP